MDTFSKYTIEYKQKVGFFMRDTEVSLSEVVSTVGVEPTLEGF